MSTNSTLMLHDVVSIETATRTIHNGTKDDSRPYIAVKLAVWIADGSAMDITLFSPRDVMQIKGIPS